MCTSKYCKQTHKTMFELKKDNICVDYYYTHVCHSYTCMYKHMCGRIYAKWNTPPELQQTGLISVNYKSDAEPDSDQTYQQNHLSKYINGDMNEEEALRIAFEESLRVHEQSSTSLPISKNLDTKVEIDDYVGVFNETTQCFQHDNGGSVTFSTSLNRAEGRSSASISLQQAKSESIMNTECVICCDNNASFAVMPCGHLCLCTSCAVNFDGTGAPCPLCRTCLLYTSPSPRDGLLSRMPSSA